MCWPNFLDSQSYIYPCLKSCEGGSPQKEDHEQEKDEHEDMEGEIKWEPELEEKEEEEEQEGHCQVEGEEPQQREEYEGADYPECTSLGFRESDEEKSLDLPESPRPLSQETRNLTASELLLNKSVNLIQIEAFL